jgi:phosphoesterase RecJ-like protein
MNKQVIDEIGSRLRAAEKILIATHVRPDGDAIGSLLGLGLALSHAGKNVQMVLEDALPQNFRHLAGSSFILREVRQPLDLKIAVDCSDLGRVGKIGQVVERWDINIDHHITNENFAEINLIVPEAVATAEIIATNLPKWGFEISKDVADALLTGVLTDTIGFRTSNMKSSVLRLSAELMDAGANLPYLYAKGITLRSYEAMRFWGAGLSKLERENGIVWTTLTMMDRKGAGYSGKDDADLINMLTTINDAKISIIFVEQPDGAIKVSWRAVPEFDVSTVAMYFGGGGHPAASGAEIKGKLEDVQEAVLEKTKELFLQAEKSLRIS